MAISPLLSLAGAALGPLARDVVDQVTDGLAFQKLLGGNETPAADPTSQPVAGLAASPPGSPAAARLEAIRQEPLQQIEAFVERLRERLQAAGINLSADIPLKVGIGGDIHVDGDHPDRAAIEELLAADSRLSATFRQLAAVLADQHQAASGSSLDDQLRLTLSDSDFTLTFQ